MQKLIFIAQKQGVSQKGREYSFVQVSNGILAFTLGNPKKIDFSKYKEGDTISLEIEVGPHWSGKGIDATVTKVL